MIHVKFRQVLDPRHFERFPEDSPIQNHVEGKLGLTLKTVAHPNIQNKMYAI